jgi:uncharacterized protein
MAPGLTRRFSRAALHAALFLCTLLTAFVLHGATSEARMKRETLAIATKAGEIPIDIEIAESDSEKALGLMFRTGLPDGQGMLFPYAQPHDITMWMRNTYIPLDMLFIRADGVVHRIQEMTEPLSETVIAAGAPVTGVLELAGGAAKRLGIAPGDRVRHRHFEKK